jgi:hypothetical protein
MPAATIKRRWPKMTYTDLLSRVGIVKANLAADIRAAKEQGLIEVPADKYFIEATQLCSVIIAEYGRTHDVSLIGLTTDLRRTMSGVIDELMQLPKDQLTVTAFRAT